MGFNLDMELSYILLWWIELQKYNVGGLLSLSLSLSLSIFFLSSSREWMIVIIVLVVFWLFIVEMDYVEY